MSTKAMKMTTINTRHVEQSRIDLQHDVRYGVIERMGDVLAGVIDTSLAARQARWNVRGPSFLSMRDLFGQVASDLDQQADAIAERIAGLGGFAEGTVQAVARDTKLIPYPTMAITQWEHVEAMAMRLGSLAGLARRAAEASEEDGDRVSALRLMEASAAIERVLWLVESHRVLNA